MPPMSGRVSGIEPPADHPPKISHNPRNTPIERRMSRQQPRHDRLERQPVAARRHRRSLTLVSAAPIADTAATIASVSPMCGRVLASRGLAPSLTPRPANPVRQRAV
jgi:hypothetical protein